MKEFRTFQQNTSSREYIPVWINRDTSLYPPNDALIESKILSGFIVWETIPSTPLLSVQNSHQLYHTNVHQLINDSHLLWIEWFIRNPILHLTWKNIYFFSFWNLNNCINCEVKVPPNAGISITKSETAEKSCFLAGSCDFFEFFSRFKADKNELIFYIIQIGSLRLRQMERGTMSENGWHQIWRILGVLHRRPPIRVTFLH